MTVQNTVYAPGARVVIRDAEWIIRRVDTKSNSGYQLTCIGLSELVKDKEAIFLSDLEKKIEILDPAETDLVHDTSSGYNSSILYIESVLRQIAPTDEKIYIGHKAAMDLVPYQLDPAIMSLQQPRQRILISDAVGLGKTLEAGILVSELIKRGKGKRILVLAIKSMLTQFQKEFWSRFTVPLTRLDSIGLQRVKNKIPTNHNPFYYYDKAIISIDTLKQDSIYREHLKNAYWDIIIIDEAHNVADRGSGALRNKLAKLISGRSDTLIMLSATPHDGRARSFASLMNMLNPTAIANPDEYTKDEIKGLFIRRFKKDIQDQVRSAFKEREIFKINVDVSAEEENVFELFVNTKFVQIDNKAHAGQLFKTTLEKSLFSSPAACLQTVRNRIKKLQEFNDSNYNKDIESLIILEQELGKINANNFNKYQKLLQTIKDKEKGFGWTGKDKTDRLVIFTERIETVNFLAENLSRDLKLTENQLEKLHGSLSDVEQQKIVEDFGKEESPLRLLIASDVASEGINLHYLSHRMIHFDIPWSLMVFQQRNGRIDRYGQEKTPQIYYLVAQSKNEKIKGDMRILEVLIDKDDQAAKNINDPSAFFKVKDINEQEILTAKAIEQSNTSDQFNSSLDEDISLLDLLMEEVEKPVNTSFNLTTSNSSLFVDDFSYLQKALEFQGKDIQTYIDPANKRIEITANEELKYRFKFLPKEVFPADSVFRLSDNIDLIKDEIKRSRKDENAWPNIQYLWELHPIMQWINDQLISQFGRHQAPVILIPDKLKANETIFIMTGMIPNCKSHPLINCRIGVHFVDNQFKEIIDFQQVIEKTELGKEAIPNTANEIDMKELKSILPTAVKLVKEWMTIKRKEFEDKMYPKLQDQLKELEKLKGKQYQQLEINFKEKSLATDKIENEKRQVDKIFDEYDQWIKDTMKTEDNPYIQVVAVLKGL